MPPKIIDMINIPDCNDDPVVQKIVDKFASRHKEGMVKYGMSLRENPAGALEWLEHFQDELMDGILYAERLKEELGASDEA